MRLRAVALSLEKAGWSCVLSKDASRAVAIFRISITGKVRKERDDSIGFTGEFSE